MAFLIIAGTLLIINAIFILASLIYTLKSTKSKGERRLSTVPSILSCQLDSRLSGQPQIALYQAVVRISGGPMPCFHDNKIPQKQENNNSHTKFDQK